MRAKNSAATEIKTGYSLRFDTSEAEAQLGELMGLLESRFPEGIEGIPSEFLGNPAGLCLDIIFTDCRSTVRAEGKVRK